MTDRRVFFLVHPEARRNALRYVAEAPEGWRVTVQPPGRSLDANALLWVYLTAFSEQLQWPVNGRMEKLTPEEWKHVLSAAFHQETARLAMDLNGGVVMLGMRTSKLSKQRFAELIEFIQAVAADRGVNLNMEEETA